MKKNNFYTILSFRNNSFLKQFFVLTLLFLFSQLFTAQVTGDFKSNGGGNWSDYTKWQVYDGTTWNAATVGQIPSSSTNVWLVTGVFKTLTADAECNDIHIGASYGAYDAGSNATARIILGTYTLRVSGKMRCFYGSIPGTAIGSYKLWTFPFVSTTGGKVSVVGNSRTLINASEWNANINNASSGTFRLDIDLNAGQTATIGAYIRLSHINVHSGTLNYNGALVAFDTGTAGQGDLTIDNGATLNASTSQYIMLKTSSSLAGTFTNNGTLIVGYATPLILATTITNNGTVEYNKAGIQTLIAAGAVSGAATFDTYNNLKLSGTSAKTLSTATTINGTLTLAGGILNASAKTLTFQNADIPISITSGTITTDASTNLNFGSAGNTGGAVFTIPNGTFTAAPSIASFTVNRDNALTFNNQALTVSGATTITKGTLAMATTLTTNGGATVNGTFQLNAGGWATGGTWTYGAAGTLVFNNTSSYGVSNGDVFWPTTNGPVNVSVLQGGLTLNSGANRTVSGLFQTAAGVTLSSSTLTLNGTAQLNSGGFFNNAPTLGSSSTLKYNTTGTYGRGIEWNNPANVQISNNTTLNYPNGSTDARSITGNLTIDAGSSFYMDYGSPGLNNRLTVAGNAVINGNLSLGDAVGGDLYVGGNWTHTTGTFAPNGRDVRFNGTVDQSITNTGGETFAYLTIANTTGKVVSLNNNVTVTNNMVINAASAVTNTSVKTLAVSGNLTINSSASGTGTFVNSGTLTVSTTTANQDLAKSRNWYMSSPVSGANALPTVSSGTRIFYSYPENHANQLISGTNPFVWSSGNYWITPIETSFTDAKGYIVRPSEASTLSFSGTSFNSGEKTIELSYSNNNPKKGFNLVGNPYPAYLNILKAFDTDNDGDIDLNDVDNNIMPTYWVRTQEPDFDYTWDTYNLPSEIVANGSTLPLTKFISPMQAFWMRAKSNSATMLTLNSSMCTHQDVSDNKFRVRSSSNLNSHIVRLRVSNDVNFDEAVLYVNQNASNVFDNYDSPKMLNGNASIPEIYTTIGSEKLVINGMKTLPLNQEIALGFIPGSTSSFSIKANEISNLPSDVKVILKDNANMVETDLTDGATAYTFSPATTSGDRFSVIFRTTGAVTSVENPQDNSILVYNNAPQQLTVICNDLINLGSMVSVYNALGQKLISQKQTSTSMQIAGKFIPGVYVVKVNNTTKKVTIN